MPAKQAGIMFKQICRQLDEGNRCVCVQYDCCKLASGNALYDRCVGATMQHMIVLCVTQPYMHVLLLTAVSMTAGMPVLSLSLPQMMIRVTGVSLR